MKFLAISLLLLISSTPIFGASFDCSKAGTAIEKAICGNDEISVLDSRLSLIYKEAMQDAIDPQQLKQEQRAWLQNTRNKCTTKSCLKDVYRQRIAELAPTSNTPSLPTPPRIIEDDLDTQVAEFMQPPAPEMSRGSWTLMGPVQGEYGSYFRAISTEQGCRMGCNLLLFDYDQHSNTPSIHIALGVLSSPEEVMYGTYRFYNIFVDGRKVGRIQVRAEVSPQEGYVILEYDVCPDITNVHNKALKGKVMTFISDNQEDIYEFNIDGLAAIESMFQ